jgi:hypothetical protein
MFFPGVQDAIAVVSIASACTISFVYTNCSTVLLLLRHIVLHAEVNGALSTLRGKSNTIISPAREGT